MCDSSDDDVDSSEDDTPFAEQILARENHKFLCQVDDSYLRDNFNLEGLKKYVPYYKHCLSLLRDLRPLREIMDGLRAQTSSSATEALVLSCTHLLYGMIHQRFICSFHCLNTMKTKYKSADWGICPNLACTRVNLRSLCPQMGRNSSSHGPLTWDYGMAVLPFGPSQAPHRYGSFLYCPHCCEVYWPSDKKLAAIDSAYFSRTFAPQFALEQRHTWFEQQTAKLKRPIPTGNHGMEASFKDFTSAHEIVRQAGIPKACQGNLIYGKNVEPSRLLNRYSNTFMTDPTKTAITQSAGFHNEVDGMNGSENEYTILESTDDQETAQSHGIISRWIVGQSVYSPPLPDPLGARMYRLDPMSFRDNVKVRPCKGLSLNPMLLWGGVWCEGLLSGRQSFKGFPLNDEGRKAHYNWVRSKKGLEICKERFKLEGFGFCPRVLCRKSPLVPVDLVMPNSQVYRTSTTEQAPTNKYYTVGLFCSCCCQFYQSTTPNTRRTSTVEEPQEWVYKGHIDPLGPNTDQMDPTVHKWHGGGSLVNSRRLKDRYTDVNCLSLFPLFGSDFHELFFQTFPELVCATPPAPYRSEIYGFQVHKLESLLLLNPNSTEND
jgi:casein kinase II subunit beta